MTKQTINIGTAPNAKNGDALRTAFEKVNANFTELYNTVGADNPADRLINGSNTVVLNSNGTVVFPNNLTVAGGVIGKASTETVTEELLGGTITQITTVESQLEIDITGIVITKRLTQIWDDGIISATDASGSVLELTNDSASIKLYADPSGPNNIVYQQFTTDGGTIIESVEEDVLGTSYGRVNATFGHVDISAKDFNGSAKNWSFNNEGTIGVPSPVSLTMTLTFDAVHYVATGPKPTLTLTSAPWELMGEYVYAPDGQSMLALNNIWPTLDNPGYESGDQFTFDASVHGRVGYTLTITLNDVVQAGPAGWTANVAASPAPAYTSTIYSDGAIKLSSTDNSNWIFGTDGNLTLPGAVYVTTGLDGGIIGTNGLNIVVKHAQPLSLEWSLDGETNIYADNPEFNTNTAAIGFGINGVNIEVNNLVSGGSWTFGPDGKLRLPIGGDIVDRNGDSVLGGSGGGISISDFGEGFSLNGANKIVTNKLYSTNLTQPTQHYRLELDTNGVVHLPDQSIINGATLKSVAGNYAGITAGPVGKDEDSWMWVGPDGAFVATDYSTNGYQWQFGNDGDLTVAGKIKQVGSVAELDLGVIGTDNVLLKTTDDVGETQLLLSALAGASLTTNHNVLVSAGNGPTITYNNYYAQEMVWELVRDQDAQIIAPDTRPWAGMPSYLAYTEIMLYSNPPGVLPPSGNMAPTAKSASDAYDLWQEEVAATNVNVSVTDKAWTFTSDGTFLTPQYGNIQAATSINLNSPNVGLYTDHTWINMDDAGNNIANTIQLVTNREIGTLHKWEFDGTGDTKIPHSIVGSNKFELRSSSVAYDAAVAGWETLRAGFEEQADLLSITGWPFVDWHVRGNNSSDYLAQLTLAWQTQQAPPGGDPLIFVPPITANSYNEMRTAIQAIGSTHSSIAYGVSIATQSGKAWNFGADSAITFPDGLATLSVDSGTGFNINILDLTGTLPLVTWNFDRNGYLNVPGVIGFNDNGIRQGSMSATPNSVQIVAEAGNGIDFWTDDGGAHWTFGTTGDITLPAGGDILDSTGTSVLGGNTGNLSFSGDNIVVDTRQTTTHTYNLSGLGPRWYTDGMSGKKYFLLNSSASSVYQNFVTGMTITAWDNAGGMKGTQRTFTLSTNMVFSVSVMAGSYVAETVETPAGMGDLYAAELNTSISSGSLANYTFNDQGEFTTNTITATSIDTAELLINGQAPPILTVNQDGSRSIVVDTLQSTSELIISGAGESFVATGGVFSYYTMGPSPSIDINKFVTGVSVSLTDTMAGQTVVFVLTSNLVANLSNTWSANYTQVSGDFSSPRTRSRVTITTTTGGLADYNFSDNGTLTLPGNIMGNGTSLAIGTGITSPGSAINLDGGDVKINFSMGAEYKFGSDGKTTLPGAVVKGTVAKTGAANVGQSRVLTVTTTPSNDPSNWSNAGPYPDPAIISIGGTNVTCSIYIGENGDLTLAVTDSTYGTVSVGNTGILDGTFTNQWGSVTFTEVTVTVATVSAPVVATAIDLSKSINKLSEGTYTLADGVEGQIMYLVPTEDGVAYGNAGNVVINIPGKSRVSGRYTGQQYMSIGGNFNIFYPFKTLATPDITGAADVFVDTNLCTLIFTDDAWQAQGGSWAA